MTQVSEQVTNMWKPNQESLTSLKWFIKRNRKYKFTDDGETTDEEQSHHIA